MKNFGVQSYFLVFSLRSISSSKATCSSSSSYGQMGRSGTGRGVFELTYTPSSDDKADLLKERI